MDENNIAAPVRHAEAIRAALAEALENIIGRDNLADAFAAGSPGNSFLSYVCGLYESMDEAERMAAVFPYVKLGPTSEDAATYETFPDVRWAASYDSEAESYTCSSSFRLEGYEDYHFEVSVIKPELSGYYFVNKLSVCGSDIYHKAYSEMAGELVDEYPVIGEARFSDVLAQVQSEVEKATNGRYDDTVLEDFWADKAEEQYNAIIALYGLDQ